MNVENDKITKKLDRLIYENDETKAKVEELQKTLAEKENNEKSS